MTEKDTGAPDAALPADRLDSWKEIAVYLSRDVRTVQRWEKTEGLPVHRHVHEKLGTVFAYKSEIEAWRSSRQLSDNPEFRVEEPATVEESSELPQEEPPRRSWNWALLAAGVVAAVVIAFLVWRVLRPSGDRSGTPGAIVILPFDNLSGDPAQEYFSDGMTEELIVQLGRLRVPGVPVIAADSSRGFKGSRKPVAQIASELGARYVVQGSVRRSGQRVRISAHLIRARDDAHLWDENYDRDLRDVLSLQTEVAGAIARGITNSLTEPISFNPASPARAVNPDAYEAFLKGRFFWNKRTPEELNRAIEEFQKATAVDPTYAPAYVGLADCYALLGSAEMGALAPRQAMPLATQAAQRALQLDSQLAEAHASLAHIKLIYDWDWAGAEKEFRRAIELNPAYATAHQWYALLLNARGRSQEALEQLRRARELDPLSPTVGAALSEAYYFARQYEPSVAEGRKSLELDPNFVLALLTLGRSLEQQGKVDEAIAAFDKGRNLSGKGPAMTMFLAHAYASKGDRQKTRELLDYVLNLPRTGPNAVYVSSLYVAGIYAGLGDKDNAMKYAERALDERCEYLIYLDRDPMADPLRSDPRFEHLLQTIGLHPSPGQQPRWTQ